MKRIVRWTVAALAGLAWIGASPKLHAQAENDPQAKQILDAVSAKYRAHDYIKAEFSYAYTSPHEAGTHTESGSLYVQPGGEKYRIQIAGQEMISDGQTAWVFLPDVNEVQVSHVNRDPEELNPAQLFTLHEKGFKYVLKGDGRVAERPAHLIDLVPLGNSPYSKMELAVEKDSKLIQQLKVFDKNGNHYIYRIQSVDFNPKLGSNFFAFNKAAHPGVEVVDLR